MATNQNRGRDIDAEHAAHHAQQAGMLRDHSDGLRNVASRGVPGGRPFPQDASDPIPQSTQQGLTSLTKRGADGKAPGGPTPPFKARVKPAGAPAGDFSMGGGPAPANTSKARLTGSPPTQGNPSKRSSRY